MLIYRIQIACGYLVKIKKNSARLIDSDSGIFKVFQNNVYTWKASEGFDISMSAMESINYLIRLDGDLIKFGRQKKEKKKN